jgi:membrane-associated phospholipid phosphatase
MQLRMTPGSQLKKAILVTLLIAGILFTGTYVMGKYPFFLLLNGNGGNWIDRIFSGWTYLGDGWIWVAVVLFTTYADKKKLPLVIVCLFFSTILSQGGKHLLFPDELRPAADVNELPAIHTVPGIELHTNQSFPSGHTATAFSIFLLACYLIPDRKTLPIGFLLALGVGYSRIYLAQHFPSDVAAGMVVGIIAVILSVCMVPFFQKNNL